MGKRIAIIAENSIKYIEIIIDAWNMGDTVVLIDFKIPAQSCLELMGKACVQKVYTDRKELFDYVKKVSNIEVEMMASMEKSVCELPESIRKKYKVSHRKEEGVILFSSGTTGKSKGIILSHYSFTKNAEMCAEQKGVNKSSTLYLYKTISHCASFVGEFMIALITGAKLYIASTKILMRKHLNNINIYSVTHFSANPSVLNLISKYTNRNMEFPSLKLIVSSGSMFTRKCKLQAQDFFKCPIINMYGMTEISGLATSQIPLFSNKTCCSGIEQESVGTPLEGVKIKVLGQKYEELKKGEIGNIYISIPTVMIGYVEAEAIRLYEDEYWFTGDMGFVDENDELFIVGRSDRMIISCGHNIYPESIERLIKGRSIVDDCYIVGLPDELLGSMVVCVYSCEIEMKEIAKNKMQHLCMDYLASYERPHYYVWKEKLSYTASGKVIPKPIELEQIRS